MDPVISVLMCEYLDMKSFVAENAANV